jgi:hypothetical protein
MIIIECVLRKLDMFQMYLLTQLFNILQVTFFNTPTFGATLTVSVAAGYENCKIVDMQRPWKCYRKIYKNVPGGTTISSVSLRGYLPTAEPLATQCIVLFGVNGMTVAHQPGQFLVTLYVVGVARN